MLGQLVVFCYATARPSIWILILLVKCRNFASLLMTLLLFLLIIAFKGPHESLNQVRLTKLIVDKARWFQQSLINAIEPSHPEYAVPGAPAFKFEVSATTSFPLALVPGTIHRIALL